MKRKVIQHGPATLVVSLPSEWTKKFGVVKGADVDVLEDGNTLKVGVTLLAPSRRTEISAQGYDRTTLIYLLRSLYRFGFDTIVIRDPPKAITYLRDAKAMTFERVLALELSRMQGMEIIEKDAKKVVLQSVHTPNEGEFDSLVRRLFYIIAEAASTVQEAMNSPTTQLFERIDLYHDDATRITSYCLRILNKKQYKTFLETTSQYRIVAILDRVLDIFRYCTRDAVTHNIKLTTAQMQVADQVCLQLSDFFAFFTSTDTNILLRMGKRRYTLEQALIKATGTPGQIRIISQLSVINQLMIDLIESRFAMAAQQLK